MSHQHLSDPQTREIAAVFAFFDQDCDGHISFDAAFKLCARLGYNVNKADLKRQNVTLLSLEDVLGWCETYAAACHRSDELKLAQLYSLMCNTRDSSEIGSPASKQGPLVQKHIVDFLEGEQHSVDHNVIAAMLDEVSEPKSACSLLPKEHRTPQHVGFVQHATGG